MAMHHLVHNGVPIPKNLSSLVGLGMKFYPIPKFARPDPTATLKRFRKDLPLLSKGMIILRPPSNYYTVKNADKKTTCNPTKNLL